MNKIKTLTIDYETYREELASAQDKGENIGAINADLCIETLRKGRTVTETLVEVYGEGFSGKEQLYVRNLSYALMIAKDGEL